MGNEVSSVLVNGKTMSFQGNFGFKLNNQEYTAKNGKVYNSQGKPIKELRMPEYIAEHFFAMSSMGDDNQDNTFSQRDIDYAIDLQCGSTNGTNTRADVRLRTLTGPKGKVQTGKTTATNGVFSSQYKSNETGRISTISVWINK